MSPAPHPLSPPRQEAPLPLLHPVSPQPLASGPRLLAVDAARGTAMLFVFLSHFADNYFPVTDAAHARLRVTLQGVGFLATPSFMLISGLMLGLLFERRREAFGPVRRALLRRGLFLLTIGHVLIAVAQLPSLPSPWEALQELEVTDTIGVALLVGPLLVPRLSARVRLLLSAGLYALSQVLVYAWTPHAMAAQLVKDVLLGISDSHHLLIYCFPFAPWIALYCAGSVLGEWLARELAAGREEAVRARLVRLSKALGGVAVAGVSVHLVMRWARGHAAGFSPGAQQVLEVLRHASSPFSKMPPGLTYLALYCGLALGILALLLRAERAGRLGPYLRVTAMLGRHSLLAFVLQFYVYYALLPWLGLRYSPAWPLYLLATVGLLLGLVRLADAPPSGWGASRRRAALR
ncbi:DUF1624 domain-containing protein [Aggregicoccus sp. 17bor-14]|uniref:heparan-alpha-glucosaminide N-acetyltransferase domain-containing protein n=1 Tax=Myxococcaceae TaxID=31 RepID=UPI00129C8F4A|nr:MULTISPECIES: heparan-alpha-glucosaminide N-acetyltransferase domain-containing protein [Myxococcaceae]MBF5043664.1 DUF1624 domain-containing protein [Simulacricoccus sp. 17bor-14]MRI89422.1 DUF1624 domain-containing protein [Aggregicoccus sp. 17bor-14]